MKTATLIALLASWPCLFTTQVLAVDSPKGKSPAEKRAEVLARPDKVMRDHNSDKDVDYMSKDDFISWKVKEALAAHDKADLDKNGLISREEAAAAAREKAEYDLVPLTAHDRAARGVSTAAMREVYYPKQDSEYAAEKKKTMKELLLDDHPALKQLNIRQSLLQASEKGAPGAPDAAAAPARMSWTWDNRTGDSFYTFDGALSYEIPLMEDSLILSPTVEAHTSNQATNQRDLLMFALPVDFGILLDDGWLDAHYVRVMGSYVTDSHQDLETVDASLLYSFDIPSLGIGATKKPWGERYPQFTWRPWIGLDYGSVSKTAGVPDLEAEKSYLRLRADVDATLWLTDFFALNGRYAHVTFLDGLERSYNYAEISAIMYLDDSQMFSIGATYRRGSPTPQFNDVDNFTIWTGFKF